MSDKKKKKKEMAPVLQDFREYVDNHFIDELLEEVKGAMAQKLVDGLDMDCSGAEIIVDHENTKLLRAEPWRRDRTSLVADCKLKIKFGLSRDGQLPRFVIRYINFPIEVTLDNGIRLEPGIAYFSTYNPEERPLPKMTKFLVPVFSYDDMEVQVMELLRKYLGKDAALVNRGNGAEELAKAMGLTVKHASIWRDHHNAAILFLKERVIKVVASGAYGTGTDDEEYIEQKVDVKTILINDNRTHAGDIDREIYHECAHYEWHSMFYELQQLHATDLQLLHYEEADEASAPAEKDVRWVERQASFAGIAAMFPRPVFEELVRKQWKDVADAKCNIGHKMGMVISRIAADKNKPRSIIRTRLINTGNKTAKGALNYVDGGYIPDFAFDLDSLEGSETFVVSRAEFTELYERDEDFRELISCHQFVYANGHVCRNDPVYLLKTSKGFRLTTHALDHVDECCLKFTKVYHNYGSYRVGELHSDQEYNEAYLAVHSLDIDGMSPEELMEKNVEYLDELPRRPSKALTKLIKDRVETQRGLVASSGLSKSTVSRMCNEDDYDYSIQDVTRIIIGLELPPPLSALFLDMTGFSRAVMVKYYRYQCIIDCMFMEDIETVVETHRALFE